MHCVLTMAAYVAVSSLAVSSLSTSDWPGFLGPNANGISPEKGINKDWTHQPPKELWRIDMHDGGYAGPSVADGRLFIIDHEGSNDIVRAIDVATGKDLWTFAYQDSSKFNFGFSRATPLVDEGRVYTVSMLGLVHCLDAKTGAKLWSRHTIKDFCGKRPQFFVSASPVIDGDRLTIYPGAQDATVAALNKHTGKTIWQGGGSDVPGYATPVVATLAARKQYVVLTSKMLLGLDAANGETLWTFPYEAIRGTNVSTPVLVPENRIFVTSLHMKGCTMVEVSTDGVKAVWSNRNINALVSTPIHRDGYLYGNGHKDSLVCVDAATGALVWKRSDFGHGGFVGVDDTIIAVQGKTGIVVMMAMSPKGYKELGRIAPFLAVEKPVWTAPIVSDSKLIVRDTKTLVCFDLEP